MRRTAVSVLVACTLITVGGCGGDKRSAAGNTSPDKGKASAPAATPAPAAAPAPVAQAQPAPAPKPVVIEPPPKPIEAAAPVATATTNAAINTICPVTGDLVDPQVPPVVVEISVVRPALVVSIGTSSARAAEIVRSNPERYAPAALDNRKATSSLDKRLSQ